MLPVWSGGSSDRSPPTPLGPLMVPLGSVLNRNYSPGRGKLKNGLKWWLNRCRSARFVRSRKSPAEAGPIRAARLEEVPPCRLQFHPEICPVDGPKEKAPPKRGQVGHVVCKLAGGRPAVPIMPGESICSLLTRLGRSGAVNRRRDGISTRHQAIAVVLNFMNPVGARGRAIGG